MKAFLKNLIFFLGILMALTIVGLLLPATPRASTSHMFAKLKTDSLLSTVSSPRLILIGGSNLSLSINSQLLKDSLHINPINTGLSWGIGFVYMFENTLRYVKSGDIIVASLEYNQFFDRAMYGGHDLVRTIFDVAPSELFNLHASQHLNMMSHLPSYAFSKFKPGEYYFKRNPLEIYDRNSINQYGDNAKHWNLPSKELVTEPSLPEEYDSQAFDRLKRFESAIRDKGATLLITFPALEQHVFEHEMKTIKLLESEFRQRRFLVMGYPERYVMPDTLMFDTPYHLIKRGVDMRTQLMIEDITLAIRTEMVQTDPRPSIE